MNKKKIMIFTICFSLILSLCPFCFNGQEVKAEETEKIVVYVAAEGTGEDGAYVWLNKTPVLVDKGAVAATAIYAALDNTEYKDDYTIIATEYDDHIYSIGDIEGEDRYYWSFYVNGKPQDTGMGTYVLKDKDKISLVYNYDHPSTQASCYDDDTSENPDAKKQSEILAQAIQWRNTLAQNMYRVTFENGTYIPGTEGTAEYMDTVYALKKAGFEDSAFYDEVYKKVSKELKELDAGEQVYDSISGENITLTSLINSGKATLFFSRIALAMNVIGKNVKNIGGMNLLEKVTSKKIYDASTGASDNRTLDCETMILKVLDECSYDIPFSNLYVSKSTLEQAVIADVDNALNDYLSDGSLDSLALTICPLNSFSGTNAKAVKEKLMTIMDMLYNAQSREGQIGDIFRPNNAVTLGKVMQAAAAYGINILDETSGADFIKNGNTLYDNIASFVNSSKGTVDDGVLGNRPENLLLGLSECIDVSKRAGVTPGEIQEKADIADAEVKGPGDQIYTGERMMPSFSVIYDGRTLQNGIDYTVLFEKNQNLGKAKITLQGMGDYTGTKVVTFKIVLAKVKIKSVKSGTVRFAKVKGAKKYRIQISTDKKFKKQVQIFDTTKLKYAYKKYKKGTTYYVRVRAINGSHKGSFSKKEKMM